MSSLLPSTKSMHTSYFHIGRGKSSQFSFDVNIKKLTSGPMNTVLRTYHSSSHLNEVDEQETNVDNRNVTNDEINTSSALLYNGVQMDKFTERSSSVITEKIKWQQKIPGPNSYIRYHRKRSSRGKEKNYSTILSSRSPEDRIGELSDKSDDVIVDSKLINQLVLQSLP